jgi:hypothetical protein
MESGLRFSSCGAVPFPITNFRAGPTLRH